MPMRISAIALVVCAFVLSCDGGSDRLAAGQSRQWAVSSGQVQERIVGLLNLPEVVGDGCGRLPIARQTAVVAEALSSRSSG